METSSIDTHVVNTTEVAAASSMFVFTAEKAGMKGVDKQHVQEVVHKMSKDSTYYQKSLRDNEKVQQRVLAMREKLSCLSNAQLVRLTQETDVRVAQMEASRDLSHIIVVVDMDMFYAAVEMRDKPELRDVPLAVGGLNMISTANYAARQYGVRAAMPGFIGKELCPELHFVPVNMEKYKRVAAQIRAVFAEYDPNFEDFSLDEACLDLTDYVVKYWHKYVSAAICSDLNKPNGQYVLPFTREGVMSFIRDLPVRKIGGIGKVTEKILNEALNVYTGAELFAQRGKIAYLFSEKTAEWLLRTSLGVRERREKQERKSFSRERTFSRLSDPKQLEAKCKEICIMLAQDLEKADKAAKNVTFVYKDTTFARCSRSMTLASAVFTADDLFAKAVELLRRELPLTLRLMGIRAATLVARSKASMDLSQPDLGNKKRQIAINKFAELVDDLAHVSASGGNRSHDQGPVKKMHVVASVAASLHNKKSSIPECEETSLVGAENTFVSNTSDDDRRPRRDSITMTDRSHAFALGLNLKNPLEVDNQPCPICGKLLNVRNNFEVNAHMDVCVLSGTSSLSRSSLLQRTVMKQPKKKVIPRVFAHVQTMSEKAGADAKPCPVCGKLLNACNSMEVNVHMDACVARSRLSAGRTTGKKRSGHEMFRKNCGNSIGAFFRKHYNDT
uniref:DNA polymerase kappa n=1 Tax=Hyaloperonospora arabidopsidis (strain Emoy2) TaxID=559515 RepID=M4BXN8_HYAAE